MQSQLFHVSPHLLRGSQAHFDFYSSPFYGTGINPFDQGITESVLGFSYRVVPHFLWQVYAVENLDFNTGSAQTSLFQQYLPIGSIQARIVNEPGQTANRLTTWNLHVTLPHTSV